MDGVYMLAGGSLKVFETPVTSPIKIPRIQSPARAIMMKVPKLTKTVYNKIVMMRIMFLALTIFSFLGSPVRALEIYVNGHRYGSVQEYQALKKSMVPSVPLSRQDENFIVIQGEKMGIRVDLRKVKTIQVNSKQTDVALHELYILSVETGVVNALQGFYRNMGPSDFRAAPKVLADQLQQVIKQAVTTSKNPKLLISRHGKMRIMSLAPDNTPKM
jgi:hypothetical protein